MEKDLIILAIYINIDNNSAVRARELLYEMKAQTTKIFEDTDKNIKILWFPIHDRETKVECVYPPVSLSLQNEEAKEIIKQIEEKLKKLIIT
jgi:hypothetical protein